MIVAHILSPHDDGASMLGKDTYHPRRAGGFHDWRYGKNGNPHPATCPTCGRKTDPEFVNAAFKATRRTWDISGTYDGYCLVSQRFRDFCSKQRWPGMSFVPLPSDGEFFVLRLSIVLPFDAERRQARFENLCPECGMHYSIIGATPAYLRGISEPITEGFFRTDLEFGSGPQQWPLIVVGIQTAEKLQKEKFREYALHAINK